jgi:hypothetical protein
MIAADRQYYPLVKKLMRLELMLMLKIAMITPYFHMRLPFWDSKNFSELLDVHARDIINIQNKQGRTALMYYG